MGLLAPYHHSYIQFTPVTDRVFKLCLRNFYHAGASLLFQLKFTDCKEIKMIDKVSTNFLQSIKSFLIQFKNYFTPLFKPKFEKILRNIANFLIHY